MGYADPNEQREYQREWNANRRATWFAGQTCVQCGSIDRLELDHVDPSTKITHNIWSWSLERRLAEIAKCQVLCHDCHLAKTAVDRMPAHGKCSRYDRYKCRCDPCRAAKAVATARNRHPQIAPIIILRPDQELAA